MTIDLNEQMPQQTLGPRKPPRGLDDGGSPEGEGFGLLGPRAYRDDLLDAERRLEERKQADKRRGAVQHVHWTRERMASAQARIDAAERSLSRDLNPIGRGRRHAEWQVQAAQARSDLAEWAEEAADAVQRARALGVTVEELRQ